MRCARCATLACPVVLFLLSLSLLPLAIITRPCPASPASSSGVSAVPDGLSMPSESAIMSRLFSMSAVNAVNNSEPTSTPHRSASSASVDWQEYNSCLEQQCSTTTCSECRDDWRCKAKCRHSCKCDCYGLPGSSLGTYGLFGKCYWERECSPKRETCTRNCESQDCKNSCEMDYLKCYCECSQQLVVETSAEIGSSVGLEGSNGIGIALRSTNGVPIITSRLAAGLEFSKSSETTPSSTTGIALKSTPRVVSSSTSTPGHSRTAAFATSGTTTVTGDSSATQTFSSTLSSRNVLPGSGITTVGEPSSTAKSATEKIREFVLCYSEERRCYDAETCTECGGDWECEQKCKANCKCGCYGILGTSLHSRDLWSQCTKDRECTRKRRACQDSCSNRDCEYTCELNYLQCDCECNQLLRNETSAATHNQYESYQSCYNEQKCDKLSCAECGGDWQCEEKCRANCRCGCYGIPGTSLHSRDLWSKCFEDRQCSQKEQACSETCTSQDCRDLCNMDYLKCDCECNQLRRKDTSAATHN